MLVSLPPVNAASCTWKALEITTLPTNTDALQILKQISSSREVWTYSVAAAYFPKFNATV